MKVITYLFLIGLLVPNLAMANDSAKETAESAGHSIKRGAKKAKSRIQEALCADSDLECKAQKAKNRVSEGAEKVGDKVDEKIN